MLFIFGFLTDVKVCPCLEELLIIVEVQTSNLIFKFFFRVCLLLMKLVILSKMPLKNQQEEILISRAKSTSGLHLQWMHVLLRSPNFKSLLNIQVLSCVKLNAINACFPATFKLVDTAYLCMGFSQMTIFCWIDYLGLV